MDDNQGQPEPIFDEGGELDEGVGELSRSGARSGNAGNSGGGALDTLKKLGNQISNNGSGGAGGSGMHMPNLTGGGQGGGTPDISNLPGGDSSVGRAADKAIKTGKSALKGAKDGMGTGAGGVPGGGGGMPSVPGVGGTLGGKESGASPAGRNPFEGSQQPGNGQSQSEKFAHDVTKSGVQVGRALAGDERVWKDIAADFAKHPIQTTKQWLRTLLVLMVPLVMPMIILAVLLVVPFFAIYKVAILAKSNIDILFNPGQLATQLKVNTDMAEYLASSARQLVIENKQNNKQGTAFAAVEPPSINTDNTNPDTKKMFDAWGGANLDNLFQDRYQASLVYVGGGSESVDFKPSEWDLYVRGKRIGRLSDEKARAFINVFTKDTTHWDDIYKRVIGKAAAKKYGYEKGRLDLPDNDLSPDKSRDNVTKQLVTDALKPLGENADTYYDCMTEGGETCDSLGFGSTGSPANSKPREGGAFSWLQSLLGERDAAGEKLKSADLGGVGQYATAQASDIKDVGGNGDRVSLRSQVITGVSDAVLDGLPRESQTDPSPATDSLLEMYDRYQTALQNGNFARVNYDRATKQNVNYAMNFYTGGGQILNSEMNLVDAWALTDNLSIVEQSPIFRSAYLSGGSAFADSAMAQGTQSCQNVFNDTAPIDPAAVDRERPTKSTSCFKKTLIPNINEYSNEQDLNAIYKALKEKNGSADSSGGFAALIQAALGRKSGSNNANLKLAGQIRTSPLAAEGVDVDPSLSPDFDAYMNQVYGTAVTGAEVNGEAFDAMWGAAESLMSAGQVDSEVGNGSAYMSDEEFATAARYSDRLERASYAFLPASKRYFSLNTHTSLAGRLALLAPSNRADVGSKVAGLYTPQVLSSAIAARMLPQAYAAGTAHATAANPMNAIRTGTPLNSGLLDSTQDSYDRNNCGSGGPTQETGKPDGVPFNMPTSVNPCRNSVVTSVIATCAFDTRDSCADYGNAQLSVPGPTGNKAQPTDGLPCSNSGNNLTSERIVTIAGGVKRKLCDYGGVRDVDASWSPNVSALLAKPGGSALSGSGFRTAEAQIALREDHCGSGHYNIYERPSRECSPPTARPGTSNHELGLAIDFSNCSTRGTSCYQWLVANAGASVSVINLPSEPWHWSVDGG